MSTVSKGLNINSWDYLSIYAILILYIFGYFFNELLKTYSIPPLATALRILILFLTVFSISIRKYKISRSINISYSILTCIIIFYLFISIIDNKLMVGIVSLRYYLEPIFVLLTFHIYVYNDIKISKVVHYLFNVIIFAGVVSCFMYAAYYMGIFNLFHSGKILNQFFLPGGLILRSFMPIGGPNELGILFSSAFILFYIRKDIKNNLVYLFLFLCLVLTISKSAIIVLMLFFLMNINTIKRKYRIISLLILSCVVLLIIILDKYYLNSLILSYVENLISGSDGSSNGHIESLVSAIDNIEEYIIKGYPTGTVGSRINPVYNIESSFILLFYDKGFIFAILYNLMLLSIFKKYIHSYKAFTMIFSISIGLFVLPTIQSIEVFSVLLILPLLLENERSSDSVNNISE